MKNVITICLIFLSIYSCTNKSMNECISLDWHSAHGIVNGINSVPLDVIGQLNKSDLNKSIQLLQKNVYMDSAFDDSFPYLFPNREDTNSWDYYSSYRVAEFIGDVNKSHLQNILLKSFTYGNVSSCLNELYKIENFFLECYLSDSIGRIDYLDSLELYYRKYPSSLRVKYLLASVYMDFDNERTGLGLLRELLQVKYYEFPVLNRLMTFYKGKNVDSLFFYSKMTSKMFPSFCNVFELEQKVLINDTKYIESYNNCLASFSKKDSIRATILLGKWYLNNKKYSELEELYKLFQSKNIEYSSSEIKIWEKGEYFDLMLKNYFIRNQYSKFLKFLFEEVGSNDKIIVENEDDLFQLVFHYYTLYNNPKASIDEVKKFFFANIRSRMNIGQKRFHFSG